MVQFSILLAIEAIVCFTPLGSIPIGPLVATLSHIPVIVAAILLGPGAGAFMGLSFGLFSFLVWTFQLAGSPVAFLFTPFHTTPDLPHSIWSIVICFVPRILTGVIAGLIFLGLAKLGDRDKKKPVAMGIATFLGTLAHTSMVLGIAYLAFRALVAPQGEGFFLFAVGFVGWNALLEIAAALIVTLPVCLAVRTMLEKGRGYSHR